MSELWFEVPTTKSMSEIRPLLGGWLARAFGDGFVRHHWQGDVLRLTGPGSDGLATVEDGKLRLRLALRPPASFLRPIIRRKIEKALGEAGL